MPLPGNPFTSNPSLPASQVLHALGPPDRTGTMLEYHVPILQHREPLPPYAINQRDAVHRHVRSGSGSMQYGNKVAPQQLVGPTNPHRPWSASMTRLPESGVTKHAPYAARLQDSDEYAAPSGGAGFSLKNRSSSLPYDSLRDPHLQEFFFKKFQNPHPPKGSGRPGRPSSANGRLQRPGRDSKTDFSYKITVVTGDKKGAGTDAKVYLRLQGSKGKLPKTALSNATASPNKKKKTKFKFKKGNSNVFKVTGKDIGELKSLFIEHDGLTKADGWFVDRIEIIKRDPKTGHEKSWVFMCKNWLSLHEGDCQISRQLFAKSSTKTEYEVVVVTGNQKGAGTDANVSITLFGKAGSTPKMPLKSVSKNTFERNRSDIFRLKTLSVGPLQKIRIQHDNTGVGAGWFLDRVVVCDVNTPKNKYYFPCGTWLAKDEGDGMISRDLIGSKDPMAVRKLNKYKITTFTGDKRGGGTDANVSITLFGEAGESGERKLSNSKNNFERNKKDEFTIECPCVGQISRIRIGHDNSGPGAGWYLEKVIVDDLEQKTVHEFPCARWFAQDEDDGCTFRDLLVNVGPMDAAAGIPYTINVMTGDVLQAGTSARVYVILYGGKSGDQCSGKIWLDSGKFDRGRTDIFNVEVATMLSPLSRIEIGHDNGGSGPGWYLDRVMVNCPSAGFEQWFMCKKWFATDEGDGLIERTLYENMGMRKQRAKQQTWFVWVYTSDIRGAGTDANVHLVAYGKTRDGEYRKSDEITLDNKGNNFEQGEVDKFKIEMIDIGRPYKIRVGQDDSGSFASWHLDRIEMENMMNKKRYTFQCGKWLSKKEDDGEIHREMPAEGGDIKKPQPLVKYNVEVHTGKKSGAGTDANVFINLFGEQGDTGDRPLVKSKTNRNKFEKGNVDEFLLEAVTLKKMKRIRIGHDGTKAGDGWFLDKVVVTEEGDSESTIEFECNRWLDVKEDDGLIVREITAGGSQLLATTSYHVSVKTGDVRGAGTDANVYLKIFGDKGDTGTLWLQSSENNKNKFERDRTDLFKPEAADIGKLEKIRIGHDGSKPGAGWFLDEVRIEVPSQGDSYVFACHRWLDKNEEDGQTELELEPTSHQKGNKKIPYEVTVWTGDVKGAGTDANVFLQMYGEYGKTEEFQLRNRTDNFEQGQMDKFKIEAEDIGPILKVRVGHDGAGMFAGWFMEKILIQRHLVKDSKRRKRPMARRQSFHQITRGQIDPDSDDELERGGGKSSSLRGRKVARRDKDGSSDDERSKKSRSLSPKERSLNKKSRYGDKDDSDENKTIRRTQSVKDRKKSPRRKDSDDSDDNSKNIRRTQSVQDRKKFGRKKDSDDSDDEKKNKRSQSMRDRKKSVYKKDSDDSEDEKKNKRSQNIRDRKKPFYKNDSDDSDKERGRPKSSLARKRAMNKKDSDSEDEKGIRKTGKKSAYKDDYESDADKYRRKSPGARSPLGVRSQSFKGKKSNKDDSDSDNDKRTKKPYGVRGRGSPYRNDDSGDERSDRKSNVRKGMKGYDSDEDKGKRSPFGRPTGSRSPPSVRGGTKKRYDSDEENRKSGPTYGNRKGYGSDEDKGKRSPFGRTTSSRSPPSVRGGTKNRYDSDEENRKSGPSYGNRKGYGSDEDKGKRSPFGRTAGSRSPPSVRGGTKKSYDSDEENRKSGPTYGNRKGYGSDEEKRGYRPPYSNKKGYGLEEEKKRGTQYPYDKYSSRDGKNTRSGYGSDDEVGGRPPPYGRSPSRLDKNYGADEEKVGRRPPFSRSPSRLDKNYGSDEDRGSRENWRSPLAQRKDFDRGKWQSPGGRQVNRKKEDYDSAAPPPRKPPIAPKQNRRSKYSDESDDENDNIKQKKRIQNIREKKKSKYSDDSDSDRDKRKNKNRSVSKRPTKSDDESSDEKSSKSKRKPTTRKGKRSNDSSDEEDGKKSKNKYLREFKKEKESKRAKDRDADEDGDTEDYWFVCNRWFAKGEDDNLIVRELLPTDEDGNPLDTGLDELEYTITVFTGDVWGAGTDANVFINLSGEFGDTGERQLKDSNNMNKFERNQDDVFTITAIELGRLKKVKIRHDNKGGGAAWFLGHVEVSDNKTKETIFFPCQRWLSTNQDDGQIARELVPVDKSLKSKLSRKNSSAIRDEIALETKAAMTTYHLYVYTGDKRGAGTDANVYITLFGDIDDTGHVFLKSSKTNKNKFERNQMDEFLVEAVDIGDLKKLRIGHDNAGGGGAWFLDRVEADCPSLGKKWMFPCGRWLAKDEDDGKLERDLVPQDVATEEYVPCIPYEITTYTSDVGSAGTDADVYVVLYGRDSCTQSASLCPNKKERKGRFERGQKDTFVLELDDVGETIEKMRIGHDGKGFGAGWHLDKVEIRRLRDLGNGSNTYTFPCKRWLARGEDDGAIERELVPDKVIQETTRKDGSVKKKELENRGKLETKNYMVEVYTGDVRGAGTDANVFIVILGDRGDTGERKLLKSETHSNKFERAQVDRFNLEAVDLGRVFKCKIRHDNAMFSPAWFLDRVEITDVTDKEKYVFYCERWLGKNKDDGKIERSLYVKGYEGDRFSSTGTLQSSRVHGGSMSSLDSSVSEPFTKSPRMVRKKLEEIPEGPTIPYTVKIVTGGQKDHGTESNAWIKIMGKSKKKHTRKLYLEFVQKKGFLPGSIETFSLEAIDVQEVQDIELGHDGVTAGSGWYVEEVEIDMPTKGRHYFFTVKQWLARDKGDGKTNRVFSLQDGTSSMVSYKPMVPYEATFITGDIKDAGTDCVISMKVFGTNGTTSDIRLEKGTDRFERGRTDLIKVEFEDIAPLKKLRLEIDGKGSRPEWFLEKVTLRNMDTGDLTTFKANKWFSRSKDEGKLSHDFVALVKGKEQLKTTTYKVSVKTSDLRGAGTDANVYIVLFGQNGDSGDLHLKESSTNKSPFENNQTDVFTFNNMFSIGPLLKIRIWHDNKGLGAAWHLNEVEVEDTQARQKYLFPCNRWFSKSDDDKLICREIACANLQSPGPKDKMSYEITVVTSDKKDAGMTHNAWLILEGEERASKEFVMENTSKNKILRRGQTDVFTMNSRNLGSLERCILGAVEREDKPIGKVDGREASWHCYEVAVTNTTTGDKYLFPCKTWINIGPKISRKYSKVLDVTEVTESKMSTLKTLGTVKYEVIVVTGDVSGAGTNANVFLTIYGTNGDTGKRPLTQKFRDLFERNQTDKFQLEAVDLGDITKIMIEHDSSGWSAGWFLDKVEVHNMVTNHQWIFPCGKWLDKKKGDGATFRELLPRD